MKKPLLIIGIVSLGGLLIWWLLRKPNGSNERPGGINEDGTPVVIGPLTCFEVPDTFPPYTTTGPIREEVMNQVLSQKSRTGAGAPAPTREQVQGLFKAINVEPAAYVVQYYGLTKMNTYFNASEGKLPHDVVVLGSWRCKKA